MPHKKGHIDDGLLAKGTEQDTEASQTQKPPRKAHRQTKGADHNGKHETQEPVEKPSTAKSATAAAGKVRAKVSHLPMDDGTTKPAHHEYGFPGHGGGFSQYLSGHDRRRYVKQGHKTPYTMKKLEAGVDKALVAKSHSNEVKPFGTGTRVNGMVANEVSITDRGHEERVLIGKSQQVPIEVDVRGPGMRGQGVNRQFLAFGDRRYRADRLTADNYA